MSGGSLNNVTSTKQNITDQVVLMAEGSGKASSVLLQIPATVGAPANQGLQVQAGADQTIQLPAGASLHGSVTVNGLLPAPGTVTPPGRKPADLAQPPSPMPRRCKRP